MDLIFECWVEDKKQRERKGLLFAVRVCLDLRPCHNRDFPSMFVRLYEKGEKDELFDRPDVIRLNAYLILFKTLEEVNRLGTVQDTGHHN